MHDHETMIFLKINLMKKNVRFAGTYVIFFSFFFIGQVHLQVETKETEVNKNAKQQRWYFADWDSLDARPVPEWYTNAKFGIFIHWGLYSVPSYGRIGAEWIWKRITEPGDDEYRQMDKKVYMKENFSPGFKYQDFAPMFKADLWKPAHWAELFKAAGARYVVLTAKHHDGYVMWPSPYAWNWNSNDTGPGRDIVGELADAIRSSSDIKFGLYNSLVEWYHPHCLRDQDNNHRTNIFVETKLEPEMRYMVNKYKPEVVWSDGDSSADSDYWKSKEFIQWLYNESPVRDTVVVNDRWGNDATCKHGGYLTCEDGMHPGKLQKFAWESCQTIDRSSWGFRRNAAFHEYSTIEELLHNFVSIISYGGNLLLNVGPKPDGTIAPILEERLRQFGEWLAVNGEAVYGSRPWSGGQNDSVADSVWYTSKGSDVYAFFLRWPANDLLHLGSVNSATGMVVTLLGYNGEPFEWTKREEGGITIKIPPISFAKLPCLWAWTLKIQNVGSTSN